MDRPWSPGGRPYSPTVGSPRMGGGNGLSSPRMGAGGSSPRGKGKGKGKGKTVLDESESEGEVMFDLGDEEDDEEKAWERK